MKRYTLKLQDAQMISTYLGLRWKDLDATQHKHAKEMQYLNVLHQDRAGDRVKLRAWAISQWQTLLGDD